MNGDGGFLCNAQEFQTAVDNDVNDDVVMNDNCWGSEKQIQNNRFDGRQVAVGLNNPQYAKYAVPIEGVAG